MIEVSVKETEPMNVAFISMHAPYQQIPQALGILYGFTGERRLIPIGAPHAVYTTPPDAPPTSDPEWELWAPVANEVTDSAPDDRGLGMKHVRGKLVVSTMHTGPYEDIEPTYRELGQWIPANGYSIAGPPEEIYFSDPNEVPPEDYVTEIQFPVTK